MGLTTTARNYLIEKTKTKRCIKVHVYYRVRHQQGRLWLFSSNKQNIELHTAIIATLEFAVTHFENKMANGEYLRTIAGIIKCISICMMAITLVLSALGTLNSEYVKDRQKFRPIYEGDEVSLWMEIYLLVSVAVCLIISVVNLGIHLASRDIYWNRKTAIYDFFYHVCSFLLLSTSGTLYIVSAVRIFAINCTTDNGCQNFELKFSAGGIAMISSMVNAVIATVVLTNRKDVERDALVGDIK